MKNIIKHLFSAVCIVICAFSIGFIVQSCSNEDSNEMQSSQTKADMLVSSDEFQAYSIASQGLADKFINNYSNLSEAERGEVMILLEKLSQNDTQSVEEYAKFCNIIAINFTEEYNRIEDLKSNIMHVADLNGINKKDLIVASKKYELHNSIPLVKNGGELSDSQLRCVDACKAAWDSTMFGCACSMNPLIACACAIYATNALAKCVEACK